MIEILSMSVAFEKESSKGGGGTKEGGLTFCIILLICNNICHIDSYFIQKI